MPRFKVKGCSTSESVGRANGGWQRRGGLVKGGQVALLRWCLKGQVPI